MNTENENALAIVPKNEVAPIEVVATEEAPNRKNVFSIDDENYAQGGAIVYIAQEALEYEIKIQDLMAQLKAYQSRYKTAIEDLSQYRQRIVELHKRGIQTVKYTNGQFFDAQTGVEINDFVLLAEAQSMAQYTLSFKEDE